MAAIGNDRWRATFAIEVLRPHEYRLQACVDPLKTWQRDLQRRLEAGQDVHAELQVGADLLAAVAERASGEDAERLRSAARSVAVLNGATHGAKSAMDPDLAERASRYPDPARIATYDHVLPVTVDPPRAAFSTWYELFPRSAGTMPDVHGTLRDVVDRLDYVASLGFDVVYLTPIHPIGEAHRKGRNGVASAESGDPGSPWAIGSPEGGHTAIHPELGSLGDFHALVKRARELGLDVALDIAFQCSPDHPWVREHPEWFHHRPDGSIQYAENPPKTYEDIYPLDLETSEWRELWAALRDVFLYWIEQGVHTFRVDNPHTKPFAFWEWVIAEIRAADPTAIFLAEAFTRPRLMYELAMRGFSQSYTYFAWRNSKWELMGYFTELTRTEVGEFFRASLWPNTPDILAEYLQTGGRPAFVVRLLLAATLGANYGIYGPAFELVERTPREPGSEEYLDSEKYEVRCWDLDREGSLRGLITRVNEIRREHPALQQDRSLTFHGTDNDQLLCYSKATPGQEDVILCVVNVDPHNKQVGFVDLSLDAIGLDWGEPFVVHDLLTDARYSWQGLRNYVELDPSSVPAHIFHIMRSTTAEMPGARR